MVYAIVVILWLTMKGTAAVAVTAAGAMVVGLYYAIRQNVPPGPSRPRNRGWHRPGVPVRVGPAGAAR